VKCTNYGAPHYAVFSSLPPLLLSQVQIFSPAPYSQTTLVYMRFEVFTAVKIEVVVFLAIVPCSVMVGC